MSKKPETFEELYQDYDAGIAALSDDPSSGLSPDDLDNLRRGHAGKQADLKDGFRKRKKRPKGWLEQAIKDGSVRDPADGPNPPEQHAADALIIDIPVASAEGEIPDGNP